MELYFILVFFLFGTIFGSFFNVVGDRLAEGKSIVYPPSHCTNCGHQLKFYELIPIFSYLFQRGRCRKCKAKLSIKYLLYEVMTGVLFSLCYISFGLSLDLIIPLTFISLLAIVIISDIDTLIIPDEVIIFGVVLLLFEILCLHGIKECLLSLVQGLAAFLLMYGIKKFGDHMFKKESMGGGDIKLMGLFGIVLGFPLSIVSIFLASILGLPISLLILWKNKSHIIPFGPFLSMAAILLVLSQQSFMDLLTLLA